MLQVRTLQVLLRALVRASAFPVQYLGVIILTIDDQGYTVADAFDFPCSISCSAFEALGLLDGTRSVALFSHQSKQVLRQIGSDSDWHGNHPAKPAGSMHARQPPSAFSSASTFNQLTSPPWKQWSILFFLLPTSLNLRRQDALQVLATVADDEPFLLPVGVEVDAQGLSSLGRAALDVGRHVHHPALVGEASKL